MDIIVILFVGLFILIIGGLRVVNQYERGVMLTLGKYTGTRNPGLNFIFWPFGVQKLLKVDIPTGP